MARLQILELPMVHVGEASETPFVLVIDQVPTDEAAFEALRRDLNDGDIAERIGARAVLVFEDTIDIPANGTLPTLNTEQGIPPGSTYQMVIDGTPIVWESAQPGSQLAARPTPTACPTTTARSSQADGNTATDAEPGDSGPSRIRTTAQAHP